MIKQYTVALIALFTAGAVPMSARHFVTSKKTSQKHESVIKKMIEDNTLWRPLSQEEYMYVGFGWTKVGSSTFTYDPSGNAIVTDTDEDGERYVTTRTYDGFNMPLTQLVTVDKGNGPVNESRRVYVYDPILHNYFVERMSYQWTDDAWVADFRCEYNTITRNGDGNIADIVKSLPLGDEMTPAYKLTWTYDETTHAAVTMAYYYYGAMEPRPWVLYDKTDYRNIVWTKTDGQMTKESLLDYCEGDNLLKSADVFYDGMIDGHIFMEYPAPGEYIRNETFLNPEQVGRQTVKTILDSNGNYQITVTEFFDDAGRYTPDATYSYSITVTNDDHGNPVLEQYTESTDGGEPVLVDGYKVDYHYDADGNIGELATFYYDPGVAGGYAPESRIVYGAYQQFSAIDNIKADAETKAVYYDLTGRVVANPGRGLYIRRLGDKVDKVTIR